MNAHAHDPRTGGRRSAPPRRLPPVHRRSTRRPLRPPPNDRAYPCSPHRTRPRLAVAAAIALAATVPALLATGTPGLAERFALDMQVLFAEPWRAVTGHWVHWSLDHLLWSGATFALLVLVSWGVDRRSTALTLAAAIVAIPLGLSVLTPELRLYGGLSGLDSALFVLVAVTLLGREVAARRRATPAILVLLLAGFLLKVGFEFVTGETLFAASAGMTGVPAAHAIGGACGALVACSALAGEGRMARQRPRVPDWLAAARATNDRQAVSETRDGGGS